MASNHSRTRIATATLAAGALSLSLSACRVYNAANAEFCAVADTYSYDYFPRKSDSVPQIQTKARTMATELHDMTPSEDIADSWFPLAHAARRYADTVDQIIASGTSTDQERQDIRDAFATFLTDTKSARDNIDDVVSSKCH